MDALRSSCAAKAFGTLSGCLLLLGALIGATTTAFAATGVTPGVPNVSSSGVASYEIPLTLPPGTNGLAPRVSLRYSHAQGNGLLGVGWSIGGLSAISRCNKTIAQDGAAGAASLAVSGVRGKFR